MRRVGKSVLSAVVGFLVLSTTPSCARAAAEQARGTEAAGFRSDARVASGGQDGRRTTRVAERRQDAGALRCGAEEPSRLHPASDDLDSTERRGAEEPGGVLAAPDDLEPGERRDGLEPLVPELAAHPYAMAPGPREFANRLCFSPAFGQLGDERLFAARLSYNPSRWLGYEASVGHNPGQSVHAVLHTVSALVRHPLPGRLQPYLALGYGMVMVFPGHALNAKPVTKNTLAMGGGLEIYLRSDLALRADVRRATVFGRERDRDGVVAYEYLQQTIGLSFYRSIKP
jgi:hypothetical protein